MDEIKILIEEFVQNVNAIECLLKHLRILDIAQIKEKQKNAERLRKKIQNALSNQSKLCIKKSEKLLLKRLKDDFNEAERSFIAMRIEKRIENIESDLNGCVIEAIENDNGNLLSKSQTQVSLDEGFDLERLRRQHKDIREIEEAVTDTNHIFHTLHGIVQEQGEIVEHIENNVENVNENVKLGAQCIAKAREYQSAAFGKLLPVVGAALGAGITGPVGLAYGFKLGGTATLAISSVCGYMGGRLISKRLQQKAIEDAKQLDKEEHQD